MARKRWIVAAGFGAVLVAGAVIMTVWLTSGQSTRPPGRAFGVTGIQALGTEGAPGDRPTPNPVTVKPGRRPPLSTSIPRGSGLGAPDGLAGTKTVTTVSLRWRPVAKAKGYAVYRDGKLVGETTGLTFEDTGLPPGTAHTWTVAAFDANQLPGDKSAPVTLTPGA